MIRGDFSAVRFFSTGRLKELNKLPCLSCLPGAPRASPTAAALAMGRLGVEGRGSGCHRGAKSGGLLEAGGVGTGPQEASWHLSYQTVPPLPTGGGRSEETHLCTGLCLATPLGQMKPLRLRAVMVRSRGWGGGSAVNPRLQKGRGRPVSMEERWSGHHVISAHPDLCKSLPTRPPASPQPHCLCSGPQPERSC